jgi:hypothetical protein
MGIVGCVHRRVLSGRVSGGGGSTKAIHAFGQCGDPTKWGIEFSGDSNLIRGGMHTDWTFTEEASPNNFYGQITYGKYESSVNYKSPAGNYHDGYPVLGGQDGDPYNLDFATYQNMADFTGSDISLSGNVADGIYYSSGKITVADVGDSGNPAKLTLVARESVEFQGASFIEPAPNTGGVLAFSIGGKDDPCSSFGVFFDGNESVVEGLVYSKWSGISWNGNDNVLDKGSVAGWVVKFNGNSNTVVADPDLLGGSPELELIE